MGSEFTWIYLSVARLAAFLCYGRQVHLSACVPHAQAGRMSMGVSYSMRSYGTLT